MRLLATTQKRVVTANKAAATDGAKVGGSRGRKKHEHDLTKHTYKSLGLAS